MIITKVKEIFTSKSNNIQLYKAGNSGFKVTSTALIIGVFHGDEPAGEYLVNSLINDIRKNPDLLASSVVLLVPCLNPDGKAQNTRENANGVDLNRDFPTKNQPNIDKEPELETKFVMEIMNEYKPDRILTIHAPYEVVNYDGPADNMAENISRLNGYPVQVDIGYPTPGSFGTYAGKERNIPIITLELPESGTLDQLWYDNRKAFQYFISLK
ncbi:MAG: hypothetical protein A2Y25_04095 [Candidatus Melainabacteria bacterium GWF2_37_15]|nr:MAG: hypothetical protein A2Y25_04095 [Candidatus Melainabacteria bacterium GWF2_37_15]